MDKGISYTDINIPETTYENYIEDRIEQDVTIPDYQAPARKVVQCSAKAIILNKSVSADSVTLDGVCVWKLVYLSDEDEALHCLSCEKPFSETFAATGEGAVKYKIKTQNVLCKLQSPQRAVCKAMLCVALQIRANKEKKIFASAADDDIQLLQENRNILRPIKEVEKEFKVTNELPVKKSEDYVVCKADAQIIVQDIKCFEDKLIMKGICKSFVLLLNRQKCEAERLESEFPFSQIIDAEGITEDCKACVRCLVTETETSILGEKKEQTVLISSTVDAQASVYCPGELSLIQDAYHPLYDLETKSEHIDYCEKLLSFDIGQKLSEKIHMRSADISILYYDADSEIEKITAHENSLIIDGKVKICLVYRQNDEVGINEYTLPFQMAKTLDSSFEHLKCEAELYIDDFSYIILNDAEIEVNCNLKIALNVFVMHSCDVLSDLKISESKHEQILNTPLVLYYGVKDERLWDIGKKYFVPISVLRENNDLAEGRLAEDKLLFISKH